MNLSKLRFFRAAALPIEAKIGDIYFIYEGVPTIYVYKGGDEPWEAYTGSTGSGADLSDYATRTWVLQQLIPIWQLLEWDTETLPEGMSIEDLLSVELDALQTESKTVIGAINELNAITKNYPIVFFDILSVYIHPRHYNIWTTGSVPEIIDFAEISGTHADEYIIRFSVTETSTPAISFEYNIAWANNDVPTWTSGWEYEVCIVIANGIGLASYNKFPIV